MRQTWVIDSVDGQEVCHHLCLTGETLWKEWPQPAVDQPRGQDFGVGGADLASQEVCGDPTCGRRLLSRNVKKSLPVCFEVYVL